MTEPLPPTEGEFRTSAQQRIDQVCDRFEKAWLAGGQPRIEDYRVLADVGDRDHLLHELIVLEMWLGEQSGGQVEFQAYDLRFPDAPSVVRGAVESFRRMCADASARFDRRSSALYERRSA